MNSYLEECPIKVCSDDVTLDGSLSIPGGARGIVIFVHGSGSSCFSPRNELITKFLQQAGLATLLFNLMTVAEQADDQRYGQYRFNIRLLAGRLTMVSDWLLKRREVKKLVPGYFGTNTGTAIALVSAAERKKVIQAVVSRGGRPDMASDFLHEVKAPTLLIVGGNDFAVTKVNRSAMEKLRVEKELAIIPGATHFFEEPGALRKVARLASEWFTRYLR